MAAIVAAAAAAALAAGARTLLALMRGARSTRTPRARANTIA